MEKIEIKKENVLAAYDTARKAGADSTMKVLESLFGAETFKPKNIMERIKTFEDALNELGDKHPLVLQYRLNFNNEGGWTDDMYAREFEAYLKLRIICAALNEGWTSELTERGDRMLPFLVIYREKDLNSLNEESKKSLVSLRLNNNLVYYEMRASPQDKYVSDSCLHLTLRNRDLSEYCGKQFKELWFDYLIGQ